MIVIGALCLLGSAGAGVLLAWQNRDAIVEIHVGNAIWTAHLYGVLIIGALMACWFLLGAAFIQCRVAERRRARALRSAPRTRERAAKDVELTAAAG